MPSDESSPTGRDSAASDSSLVRRVREGESDAATALYLRYARRLQLLAERQTSAELRVRVDRESIVQSVFRTFFRRVSEGHYDIPNGEELWKLFLVMALNKIRTKGTHHRAAKRNVSATRAQGHRHDVIKGRSGADEEAYVVLQMTIDDLTREMTPGQRDVILLRIEGHGIEEIAEQTRKSKRSVERLLQGFRWELERQITGSAPS